MAAKPKASNVPIHSLDLRILLVVADGPAHGYRIVQEIERAEGRHFRLYPANLYRRIRDLAERGSLVEVPSPEGEDAGPRPRTYFDITSEGRTVVAKELARLEKLLRDGRAVMGTT